MPKGAISWTEAADHVGSKKTVCGDVMSAKTATNSKGQPTFLDVGAAYPDPSRVSVVIWGENLSKFRNEPTRAYSGKSICVKGELYLYQSYVQIEATKQSQIRVIS